MLDITAGMRPLAAGLALAWGVAAANTSLAAGAPLDSVAAPVVAASSAPRPTASAPT